MNLLNRIRSNFKTYLIAGLVTIIPIAVTLWTLKLLIIWSDNFFKGFFPRRFHPENLLGFHLPGIGIVLTLILVLLTGMLTRLYLGRKLLDYGDKFFRRIPFGKGIYKALKDFTQIAVPQEGKEGFKRVAMIEYPRKGLWVLVLVTGKVHHYIQKKNAETLWYVFVPTTPNPTSGFLIIVPESELTFLDIGVDQGVKTIISAGIVQDK